jgi:competence protein ComEA
MGAVIEKYRFAIGAVLILAILAGGGLLAYRLNHQTAESKVDDQVETQTADQGKINQLTAENEALKTKIGELEKNLADLQTAQATAPAGTTKSSGKVAGASTVSGVVNINTATLSELDSLPEIGPVYAQRIIDYRTANGGFKTLEEIINVNGIGEKTFEKFKDKITL